MERQKTIKQQKSKKTKLKIKAKKQKLKTAKQQKKEKRKKKKKKKTAFLRVQLEKYAALISSLSVRQTTYLDFFLCGTTLYNQFEPQWIVAQKLLSARTIPEVFKSSGKECSFE